MVKGNIGPTGQFPDGKIRPDDGGELQVGITVQDGNVIIGFGTFISWVAIDKEKALAFAELIIQNANKL